MTTTKEISKMTKKEVIEELDLWFRDLDGGSVLNGNIRYLGDGYGVRGVKLWKRLMELIK